MIEYIPNVYYSVISSRPLLMGVSLDRDAVSRKTDPTHRVGLPIGYRRPPHFNSASDYIDPSLFHHRGFTRTYIGLFHRSADNHHFT